MRDADRFKLLGTYKTPRVRIGRLLTCEVRDQDVIVVGYSDGRIPWPRGRLDGSSRSSLVVFGALADAVRTESNQAVAFWFGVQPCMVSKWRKALEVEMTNDGTRRLRQAHGAEEWFAEVRANAQRSKWTPDRKEQLAARCRGKPRPAHVVEAMRKGRTGKPQSEEARAKMRSARKPGFAPNGRSFTAAEDELIRTLPAAEAARQTGRSLKSIYTRRIRLRLPDGRAGNGRKPKRQVP